MRAWWDLLALHLERGTWTLPCWHGKVNIWVQHAAPWLSWEVAGIEETKVGPRVHDCSVQCPGKCVEPVTGSGKPTASHLFHFAPQ